MATNKITLSNINTSGELIATIDKMFRDICNHQFYEVVNDIHISTIYGQKEINVNCFLPHEKITVSRRGDSLICLAHEICTILRNNIKVEPHIIANETGRPRAEKRLFRKSA